jgi:hypothetical protein
MSLGYTCGVTTLALASCLSMLCDARSSQDTPAKRPIQFKEYIIRRRI